MEFICDYALIDPMTLCNRINRVNDRLNPAYRDIDDDAFSIAIYTMFGAEELTSEEAEQVEEIVTPYLLKQGLTTSKVYGILFIEREVNDYDYDDYPY